MTRGLTPALIRQFKTDWETRILRKRDSIKRLKQSIKEDPFVKFEIKRLVFSLPAFKDKKTTESIFEQLYNWHLFSNYTRNIFDALESIHWFLEEEQVMILLDRVYEYFWHLVGPEEVNISKSEQRNILRVIELIGDLGEQTVILQHNPKVFNNFFYTIDKFTEISQWYNLLKIANIIKIELTNVRKELRDTKKYPERRKLIEKINIRIKKLGRGASG
jgi:hypothetical protein